MTEFSDEWLDALALAQLRRAKAIQATMWQDLLATEEAALAAAEEARTMRERYERRYGK